jgi:hypothetical protein
MGDASIMNDTAEILLMQFLTTLRAYYNLDEARLKVVEDEARKAVAWVLADQAYDAREAERKKSLPPPVSSKNAGTRKSHRK